MKPLPFRNNLKVGDKVWDTVSKRFGLVDRTPGRAASDGRAHSGDAMNELVSTSGITANIPIEVLLGSVPPARAASPGNICFPHTHFFTSRDMIERMIMAGAPIDIINPYSRRMRLGEDATVWPGWEILKRDDWELNATVFKWRPL